MSQFRMPAEWEPQEATWLGWPCNKDTWPENLAAAQAEFVALVRAICESQQANVMVGEGDSRVALESLAGIKRCRVLPFRTNDAWARDYAPTFVVEQDGQKLVSVDWHYNAWGGKYPPFENDQQIAKRVADHLQIQNVAGGICFEGGAIEVNSDGVLLTTESCALNLNRNAGKSRSEVESILMKRLGCKRVVWLPGDSDGKPVLPGDDTDGHVDQLFRFVNDSTIVHAACHESDARWVGIAKNVNSLKEQLPDVQLVPLQLPNEFEHCGRVIPASYCNFVITNHSVIVPQFEVPEDSLAVETIHSLFPNRKLVPLPCRELAVGLGSFHCLTQQQPKV
ncbi:MAG: agmatine deiminase family protein [Planctomycetota bacterium]